MQDNRALCSNFTTFQSLVNGNTNNLLKTMDWSNVVIAGGFIYGLLSPSSMLAESDIDLFIYGDTEQIREQKCQYLMNHFKDAKPYYIINKSVITIIIPTINRDIQIIVTDKKSSSDITNNFDLNYTRCFYNGEIVMCSEDCIYAL